MSARTRGSLRSAGWLLALLALTLAPRAALAVRRQTICSDAVFFIERGQALAHGDVAAGLAGIGLNLYTLLLAGAVAVDVDPATFGRWLSVLASALTVVPLAWLTDQWFGRRAGVIAGLMLAVSPEALDWSVEAIRDPLFWLMFTAGVASAWRASVTQALRDYVLWGLAFTAAILLRTEGALLVVPLAGWCGSALWHRPTRTALRLLSGLACWPAALVVINLGLLIAGHDRLELGRLDHLKMLAPVQVARASPSSESDLPRVADERVSVSWREVSWAVRHNVIRGVGWPCAALALLGAVTLDRRALREQIPMFGMGVGLLLAMAVYFLQVHELTARYAAPLLLIALPLAGRGADWLWASRQRLRAVSPSAARGWGWLGAAALAVVCLHGIAEGLGRGNDSRTMKQALGLHLAARYGAGHTLLATENLERLVGYYAEARHISLPRQVGGLEAVDWLRIKRPELVVLWTHAEPERYAELLAGPCCLGYLRRELPAEFAGATLLVRRDVGLRPGVGEAACQTAPRTYTSVASVGERPGSARSTMLTR